MSKVLGFQIEINGTQRVVATSEEMRRAIADLGKELKKATDTETIKKLEKELIELKARQAELNKETREAVKARQAELNAVDESSGAYNKLSKELNTARQRYKDLAAAQQENSEEAQQLLKRIEQLDDQLKSIDGSVGQFQRNVGNYQGAISTLFPAFGGLQQSINDIGNATTRSGKLAAGAIAAFEGFQLISGIVQDLNQRIEETRRVTSQVQSFTKETGAALENTVAITKALSKTFGEDTQDIINAANAASKELGTSFDEALLSLEVGLRKGANAQGEFLDSFREYPSQLAQAGFSLEEFTALAIDAAEKGVYSDKAIDAVKEFGIQTREQTKSVRDSFIAAFGPKFTDELFSNLNRGAITGRDALALVTNQIKETGVAGAELQGLISTVFVGAGEDAGRYVLSLGDVLNKTEQVLDSTTEYESQLNELFKANLELEQATASYNEALADFSFELQVATAKGKTFLADILKGFLEFGNQLPATFAGIKAGFAGLFERPPTLNPVRIFREFFQDYNKAFKKEVRKIKDEDEVQKAVVESLEKPKPETQRRIATASRATGKAVAEQLVKGSVEEIEKRKADLDKAFERTVAGSDAQRAIAANLEAVNKELENAIAAQNRILEQGAREAFKAQVSSIGEEFQFLSSQLTGQGFADRIIGGAVPNQIVQERKETNKELEKLFNELTEKNLKALEKQISDEREAVRKRKELRQEIIASSADIVFAGLDVISAFQQARAEKEQEAFAQELERIDANIKALEEKQQNAGRIRRRQIQQEIDGAKAQREQAEKQAEEAQKKAAKREKTLAIIQATIQGALAVTRAIAAPPGFPFNLPSVIATGVQAAAQVAIIAAQPLADGGVISGRRVTDRQNIPTTPKGDNVLAVVRRGEVVLNERQQAALGGPRTFRAIRVPGFADGGITAPPITAPPISIPGPAGGGDVLAALDKKTDAINARIDRLKAYVVSEDVARDLEEGDRLRVEATL